MRTGFQAESATFLMSAGRPGLAQQSSALTEEIDQVGRMNDPDAVERPEFEELSIAGSQEVGGSAGGGR